MPVVPLKAMDAVVYLLYFLLCLLRGRGCVSQAPANDVFCAGFSADARVVSTGAEASALSEDLDRCPGLEFNVYWRGAIGVSRPFELTNATRLWISGESKETSVVDGEGESALFVVSEVSELYLEGLGLSGGYGNEGGAVAASGRASLTLVDCDIYGNRAGSNGGAIHLDERSTFSAGGVNFTGNSAEVYGGAIHAQGGSTVATEDGTANLFQDNSAKLGGAVHAQDSSTVLFGAAGETSFAGNSALFQGGAVNLEHSCLLKTDGTTYFTDNTAGNSGGAIRASNGSEVVATGNTTFLNNSAQDDGGAIVVTEGATMRTRGDTELINNHAPTDGGAIKAELSSRVQIAGRTLFLNNTAGNFGGAISAHSDAVVTTVGEVSFIGNTAKEGGAMHGDTGVIVALAGAQLYDNNSAWSDGGAIHLSYAASVTIIGRPHFSGNMAIDGSGGAVYCASIPQATFKNANFTGNSAQWGGAFASFSSGGSVASSSTAASAPSVNSSDFWTSRTDYDQSDLTPSLTSEAEDSSATVTSLVPDSFSSDDGSTSKSSSSVLPVNIFGCMFDGNRAREDGGAIYSVAGFDVIQSSHFVMNRAEASGGAIVHSGVMEAISDTVFEENGAGNEGPAVLSLGLLSYMSGVTFENNAFYCGKGKFGTETEIGTGSSAGEDECRFERVCSRCASTCNSQLQSGVVVVDEAYLPACEKVPVGSQTTKRGGTLATLELLPGFYRSSAASTDIRECFYDEACKGGRDPAKYCAKGYGGPYCAVCTSGYSPGYSHTCKSCLGGRKSRALGITASIVTLALVAAAFLVARLVSVVETGPPTRAQSRWQQKCSEWQTRMKKIVPLTAVKIVVVVWQIVTQYSDVAGVKYPGAYNNFLSVIDVVNVDVGFILSLACVYDTDFYDRLLMATICPAFVLGLLGCTYWVAHGRNRHSEEAIGVVRRRHLSVALFVMFVVYATVSYTIFQTFVCDALDDGNSYLRADYSLTCSTGLHTAYRLYAGVMVVVYPVGIPCVFGWWLLKYRGELKEENRASNAELQPLADLWQPYTRSKYYYEVVECFRRIALTGFAVFIYPSSSAQIAIVLLLAVIFMVVSEIISPFARPAEMWLYRAGHYVVFASMYLSLLLRVDVSDENDQSQEVFSGVIVMAHAAMILVVVGQGLLIFVGWGSPGEDGPAGGISSSGRCADNGGGWGGEASGREGGGAGARVQCGDANSRGRVCLSKGDPDVSSGAAARALKGNGDHLRDNLCETPSSKRGARVGASFEDGDNPIGTETDGKLDIAKRQPGATRSRFRASSARSSRVVEPDVSSPELFRGQHKAPVGASPSSPAVRASAMARGAADALVAYPGKVMRKAMATGENANGDDKLEAWRARPRSLSPKSWYRERSRAENVTGLRGATVAKAAAVGGAGTATPKALAPGANNGNDRDGRETRPLRPRSLGPERGYHDGSKIIWHPPRKPVVTTGTVGREAAGAGKASAVDRKFRSGGEGRRRLPGVRRALGDEEPTGALSSWADAKKRPSRGPVAAATASGIDGGRTDSAPAFVAPESSRRPIINNAALPKTRRWAASASAAVPVHHLATSTFDSASAAAGARKAARTPAGSSTPISGKDFPSTTAGHRHPKGWSGFRPARGGETSSRATGNKSAAVSVVRDDPPLAVAPTVLLHPPVRAFGSEGISGLGKGFTTGSKEHTFVSAPGRRPPTQGRRPNARVTISPGGSSMSGSSSVMSVQPWAAVDSASPKKQSESLAAVTAPLPVAEETPSLLRRPIGVPVASFGSGGVTGLAKEVTAASTQRNFTSAPATRAASTNRRANARVVISPGGSSMSGSSSVFSVPRRAAVKPAAPKEESESLAAVASPLAEDALSSLRRPTGMASMTFGSDGLSAAGARGAGASARRTFSSAPVDHGAPFDPHPFGEVSISPGGSSMSGRSSVFSVPPPSFSAPPLPEAKSRSRGMRGAKAAPKLSLSVQRPPGLAPRAGGTQEFGGAAGRRGAAASMHRSYSTSNASFPPTQRPPPVAQVILSPVGSSMSGASSRFSVRPAAVFTPDEPVDESKLPGEASSWSLSQDILGERKGAGTRIAAVDSMSTLGLSAAGLFRNLESEPESESTPKTAAVEASGAKRKNNPEKEAVRPPLDPDAKGRAGIFSNNARLGMLSSDGTKQTPVGETGRGGDTEKAREKTGDEENPVPEILPADAEAAFPADDEVLMFARPTWVAETAAKGSIRAAHSSAVETVQQHSHDRQAAPFMTGFGSISGSSVGEESAWSFGGLGGGGGFAGNAKRSFYPEALAPLCSSPAGVAAAVTARLASGSAVDSFTGSRRDGLGSPVSDHDVNPAGTEPKISSNGDDNGASAAEAATSSALPPGAHGLGNHSGVSGGSRSQHLGHEEGAIAVNGGEGEDQEADSLDAEIAFFKLS